MVQCVAVCCSVLQCVAVCCSVLHQVKFYYISILVHMDSSRIQPNHFSHMDSSRILPDHWQRPTGSMDSSTRGCGSRTVLVLSPQTKR